MGMGDFEAGDDEGDTFSTERTALGQPDLPGDRGEMRDRGGVEVDPVVDFGSRYDKGVALADRGNRQERHTDFVLIDESAWEFTIDDS